LVAAALVTVVVRGLSQPLTDLTEAAERVVQGDLDTRIAPTDDDSEVGRLSEAFNVITSDLRQNMSALQKSRADLSVSLQKIGETLTNTHDLDGLLEVVLDTAVVTLQAKAGVVLYGAPEQMHVVADRGMHEAGLVAPAGIAPGVGVLGRVVTSGEAVRGRLGSTPALEPAGTEPGEGNIFAVPLRSMGNVVGVLALYDRIDGRPFAEGDVESLGTLSTQASIAMDNVQLHQEAQRLSTTDGLTGLWNFRYLSSSLGREIERANRFERPLAVLMLDIDHFKQVNDQHGHARGDAVLRELAQRVQEQIREVDTFARYGGEEFVVVLPETTVEGATQLAERICVAVRREPFHAEGEESLKVTVSVGGAAFPAHGSSAATLMRAADRALYVAKNNGRDRWHVPET
jgi:two-component system, cell cycle response regulator